MKDSALYVKIVEWSDEDQCFIGQCPGIVGPCCHGDDETQVYAELCDIVEEWIAILKQDGKPLPAPTIGKKWRRNSWKWPLKALEGVSIIALFSPRELLQQSFGLQEVGSVKAFDEPTIDFCQ